HVQAQRRQHDDVEQHVGEQPEEAIQVACYPQASRTTGGACLHGRLLVLGRSSERAMSLAPAVGIAGAFPCPLQAAADSAPRTLSVRAFSWRGRDGACRPRGLLLLL